MRIDQQAMTCECGSPGYLSWSDREEALKRFDTAIDKSRSAWHKTYDKNDDHRGAIEIWKQMFGDKFPAYG